MIAAAEEPRGGPTVQLADVLPLTTRRMPARLRRRLEAELAAGRAAAQAGQVDHSAGEVPAADEVLHRQWEARQAAFEAALPAAREDARTGVASLAADQHADALREWLADPEALTLVLSGRTGSGKTQAAYAVAAEACHVGAATRDRKGVVRFRELLVRAWTVNGYVAELRPNGAEEPEWKIRDRARTAELLILDDLGAETDTTTTEHVRRELVELIDYRLEHRLRTVITTNLSSKATGPNRPGVTEMYGERFLSRLAERATGLMFLGQDRRRVNPLGW